MKGLALGRRVFAVVWRVGVEAATVLAFLAPAGSAQAVDGCDRLLRQWIDEGRTANLTEAQYNLSFERLAQLERAYGDDVVAAVDAVFKSADPGLTPKMMDQFLAKRAPEEARRLFELGAGFASLEARRGLAIAAGAAPFQGVEAGTSAYEFAKKSVISPAAKEQFFRGLSVIGDHGGASRLLKRAGVANDYGAVFEVAADAKLAETGQYGHVTVVDYDESGQNEVFSLIDTTTLTAGGQRYAFQSKSAYDQERKLILDSDISVDDLSDLARQAADLGATPVLISNVGFDGPLVSACSAKGILMEPNWLRVAE
jgi:hypothetical protein